MSCSHQDVGIISCSHQDVGILCSSMSCSHQDVGILCSSFNMVLQHDSQVLPTVVLLHASQVLPTPLDLLECIHLQGNHTHTSSKATLSDHPFSTSIWTVQNPSVRPSQGCYGSTNSTLAAMSSQAAPSSLDQSIDGLSVDHHAFYGKCVFFRLGFSQQLQSQAQYVPVLSR